MDVFASSDGEFHIKLHICDKADNFTWTLVAVYGAARDEFKTDFLHELVKLAKDNPYLFLYVVISSCYDSHMRKATVDLIIIGLSFSTLSSTV